MTSAGDVSRRAITAVSCDGKIGFDSRELALGINRRCNRRKTRGRSIYRCRACHKWHQGSTVGRVERLRAADLKKQLDRQHRGADE